jgi:hypothetical protein
MDRPAQARLPWELLLTLAALGIILTTTVQVKGDGGAASWQFLTTLLLTAGSTFLIVRWLVNWFWGVAAALLVVLQPLWWDWRQAADRVLPVPALLLVCLAATLAGVRTNRLEALAAPRWGAVAVILIVALALTWLGAPPLALAVSIFIGVGLLGGAFAAWRSRSAEPAPSVANLAAAACLGLAAPIAGLFLAPPLGALLQAPGNPHAASPATAVDHLTLALEPAAHGLRLPGFSPTELEQWCWPTPWLLLPLAGWGLLCSLRRGLGRAVRPQSGSSLLLLLFTGLLLLGLSLPAGVEAALSLLLLASLAMLLAVYGIGDTLRRLMERLVLPPPGER